ncbi:MAG TPA: shikimate dehydrogenase [Acidimicrobiales bacterium]|nr:shikimate dehydrogenase [Acidimicrobiales bacterium]
MAWPGGATRVAAVIGDPIGHSVSPAIHNAGFEAAGLDWVFVAFAVPAGGAGGALAAVRALGLGGLSVTTPHKDAVAALVDRLSPTAAALGAVNTVVPAGGDLVGDSTDGAGFVAWLRRDEELDPAGRRCLVRGTGGAGRAVVLALVGAGAAEVVVVAGRDRARADALVALAGRPARAGGPEEVEAAELVVNATSLGLAGRPGDLAFPPDRLGAGQVVVDLNYPGGALVEAAAARGAVARDGVGMLVHQAALAFELWTGQAAPVDALWAGARRALEGRGRPPAAAPEPARVENTPR